MKKKFLTEQDRLKTIQEKSKRIVKSFKEQFNKIKRDDDCIEDGINPITGYDLDKESPGLPKSTPQSTQYNPITYDSSQIEKSTNDIRNNRDRRVNEHGDDIK